MLRTALGLFVLAHAVITAVMWVVPLTPDAPFDPGHSWLLGDSRSLAAPLSVILGVGFAISGVGLLLGQDWWAPAGLASGAAGTLFLLLYFHPWLILGVAINAAIAAAAGLALPQS